jgi:uncharacterized protein (TIGR02646 family)
VIRITKPTKAPVILRNRGASATRQLCEQYDAEQDAYIGGVKRFVFDRGIYGSKSVKNALLKAQDNKCAFCEAKVSHVAHGDVEHFRPKGGYQQSPMDQLTLPGYYWLAYDWSNLLFCCQICNQSHKRNGFPLVNQDHRARSHTHDIRSELPLLIDPASEEPADFVDFNEEYIRSVDGNARGETTIQTLGLNRSAIAEKRREALVTLKLLLMSRDIIAVKYSEHPHPDLLSTLAEIDARLRHLASNSGEYSAMVRAVLRSQNRQ